MTARRTPNPRTPATVSSNPQAATARVQLGPPAPTGPILETDFVNTPLPNRTGNWPKKVARGTFLDPSGPAYGWLNLHNPNNEYDVPLTGLSGTIVSKPDVSDRDIPFLHPFHFDFEFLVAPDAQYADLVAPNQTDSLYKAALNYARNNLGLNVDGVIGMEIESDLVPKAYRPVLGDRTCLFGRWIVDAAHDDFHTEIHPPLIMANAHPGPSSEQIQNPRLGNKDATNVTLLGRPFLISQNFGDGGLLEHLVKEIAKAEAHLSLLVEAHPRLLHTPFVGLNIVTFKVRPPTPRNDIRDQLHVELKLARRSRSTAIQVLRGSDRDSIRVIIVLNEAGYDPPPEPPRVNKRYRHDDLQKLDKEASDIMDGVIFATALLNPTAAPVLARGIEGHKYSLQYAPLKTPTLGNTIRVRVDQLAPVDIATNPSMAFPIAGEIKVEWERFRILTPPGPIQGRSQASR